MRYEDKGLIKIYEHLSKKGIKTSEDELLKAIFELAFEKEDELLAVLRRKKSEEILKRWLETPVEVEKTDALKEHNSVV
ncbi:MAG TPA: hypothetical protein C5S37_08660 [Methanophagales archaeon]|nr:hypothetical protein [Methanophagales archaeon]HJH25405.1 hypothetical protein [Methanophagales archaeon]HJH26825.1 hypothetical protein [Methanophagales archaeon]